MRNLFNPKWILLVNTLPIVVLLFLFSNEFAIIKSLLNEQNLVIWDSFFKALLTLGILNLAYAILLIVKRFEVSYIYAFAALFIHISFIYWYGYHSGEFISFEIPRWMLNSDLEIYPATFMMPTLVYSLFILVVHYTPKAKEIKALRSFLLAIIIPIAWYLFVTAGLPLWSRLTGDFGIHIGLVFIISGTVLFLFFVIRGVYIITVKKERNWTKYQLLWKIPISLLLPLAGLMLNNGNQFNYFSRDSGVFGDFSNHWFYILTVLNAIFICLPELNNKTYRLVLYIGRSIFFSFTLYFFFVFLPFLPLSVVAIIAVGVGFLMLSPLILFVLHVNELSKDFKYLKSYFNFKWLIVLSVACVLILPTIITVGYLQDKQTLENALGYIYSPDYSQKYDIDQNSLSTTLKAIKGNKERNNTFIGSNKKPYLSTYYNWLVLDNLTLSESKINMLERVFFNAPKQEFWQNESRRNEKIAITKVDVQSHYDEKDKSWKSNIEFEITNQSEVPMSEYVTTFELPDGAWISDYYLYIEGRKEQGILAEKKSALWVYSNIVNVNRDPGILYYLNGNKIEFHVFPFSANETRKTGFEIVHKNPFDFSVDEQKIELAKHQNTSTGFENDDIAYITAEQKQQLKAINRKPYFHFIWDSSNTLDIDKKFNALSLLKSKYPQLVANAKITFANTYITTQSLQSPWQDSLKNAAYQGSFFLDRAIQSILYNHYKERNNTYPIMVVVTDNLINSIKTNDLSNWKFAQPEGDAFYVLGSNGMLDAHTLDSIQKPIRKEIDIDLAPISVLEYAYNGRTSFLANNHRDEIVLKNDDIRIKESDMVSKSWNSDLLLHAKWMSGIVHPQSAEKDWLSVIKGSFASQFLTHSTSYIALENEAQKAILKKKQEQVLAGNKSFDLQDDIRAMSEPNIIIGLILLAVVLWIRKVRMR